jgi:hypothetical protein
VVQEHEDAERGEARAHQRQGDAEEDPGLARPVHARGVESSSGTAMKNCRIRKMPYHETAKGRISAA